MFKNIFNFNYQRTIKEAFLFYLAYLLIILSISLILAGLAATILRILNLPKDYGKIPLLAYTWLCYIFYIGLAIKIVIDKKNVTISSLFLIFLTFIIGYWGDIFGLIPATILSTFPNRNISE